MVDKQLMTERDPLPDSFDSLEEAAEFWDTHSTADYEDLMEEAVFDIKEWRLNKVPLWGFGE